VIDGAQGVEAQTVANANLAIDADLAIIPVINKMDLPAANAERSTAELEGIIGLDPKDVILASAKQGLGIPEILAAIIERIPPPQGDRDAPLKALIFDSHFDPYLGIIAYVRVIDGQLRPGMQIRVMSTGREFEVAQVGVFTLGMQRTEELSAGEVGFISAGAKNLGDLGVGATITDALRPAAEALPGYREPKPMVFCGLYPTEGDEYPDLREALDKLRLNDASLQFVAESSSALGFGFRCGFLGLLHLEIIQERLEREYNLDLVATSPSVVYRVTTKRGEVTEINSPAKMPPSGDIQVIEEPYVNATIVVPREFVGPVLELAQSRRGELRHMEYSQTERVILTYDLPLSEILLDFFDQLKSRTKGYGSFDYQVSGYRPSDLVRLTILINNDPVDALSFITHRERAYRRGRQLVEELKKILPRQMFEIRLQAAIDSRVIAAESVRALRKNVLAKCYGGDITRKRKLLEKQKAGKKRMKQVGSVEIPQEAFLSILKVGE
jgi:GTP-binding protein LepA